MSRIKLFFMPVNFKNRNCEVFVREFEGDSGQIEYKVNSPNESLQAILTERGTIFYRNCNSRDVKYGDFDQTTEEGGQKKKIFEKIAACLQELS